ncbi:MAG: hypothetical protein NC313_03775 [Butyrivibrio sp.]|nr:hypothetical protein [Butyrivibrio sp.]
MISVILIWIYMIITCYLTGYAVLWLLAEKQGYSIKNSSSYLYAGIVAVTVYAQFFSIFYKVGCMANVILLIICGIIAFYFRKELCIRLGIMLKGITPIKAMAFILIFLLFAYGTSTGIIHYDTGLYHAQSIRWIEEYGVVPGLGNLHNRLAYNSASFCLSAMYSFAFLGGRSFHCCAGFMAFLLAIACVERCSKSRIKKPCLSDFARIMGLYYLLIIFDEMISPASDYFMVLSVFYIIIRWLDLLENNEKAYIPYALLCLMGVSVVTIKLSGAMILLLTLKPLCRMIKEKKGKQIALFISAGFIVAVPFFIRNVILSGWLVYPLTFIDIFNVDFKIPKELALYDAREIQVWGRGYYNVAEFNAPITEWLPGWIGSLSMVNKLFLLLAFLGIFMFIVYCIYAVIKDKKDMADTLLVMGTVGSGLIFFILSSPLIRYGCVFLWVFPALVWGYLYLKATPNFDRYRIFLLGLLLIGVYKTGAFAIEIYQSAATQYLLVQKDYEDFETLPYEIDGYTFYYSEEGDRTGYKAFPSTPYKMDLILRGDTLKDGFRLKN